MTAIHQVGKAEDSIDMAISLVYILTKTNLRAIAMQVYPD